MGGVLCARGSCSGRQQERLVFYCRTTSASTAPCTSRRMCCLTHCARYCAPCQPLLRAFSRWIRSPPPTPGSKAYPAAAPRSSTPAPRAPRRLDHPLSLIAYPQHILASVLVEGKGRVEPVLSLALSLSPLSLASLSPEPEPQRPHAPPPSGSLLRASGSARSSPTCDPTPPWRQPRGKY